MKGGDKNMKIKDLKKWCEKKDEDAVVIAFGYSPSTKKHDHRTSVKLDVRPPRANEFKHEECDYCELYEFKGKGRKFCTLKDEFIKKDEIYACRLFIKTDCIILCKECEICKLNKMCSYHGDDSPFFIEQS